MRKERENGFEVAFRERYSISINTHYEEVENIITKLLDEPMTAVDAAEIVLGRRVEENETHIINLVTSHLTAEKKFEKLVVQKNHEERVRNLLKNGKK